MDCFFEFHWNSLVSLKIWNKYARSLVLEGIPFVAHLARSLIPFFRPILAQEMAIFFSLKRLNYCPRLMVYIHIKMFCTWAHWKMLSVEISLVSQYNTFLQWILHDITYYTFKDARYVSLYPYNRSQNLQFVKYT